MPFEQSMSPRSQGMQQQTQGQSQQSAEEVFQTGFTQMAYDSLKKSNPELLGDVVTFRVLDVDPTRGMGVGAFILAHQQDVFYIPAVIADNTLKPLDQFYSRRLDRYYPLTSQWLRKATDSSLGQMGNAVEPPKTLQTDVDIRGLVIPPTTGRYSYAEDQQAGAEAAILAAFQPKTASIGLMLPDVLSRASENVREGVRRAMRKHAKFSAQMARVYGRTVLANALAPREEKSASHAEFPMKHDVFVLHLSTPMQDVREIAGSDAAKAYGLIRTHGFYVKDTRQKANDLIELATEGHCLTEPKMPGLYTVYLRTGEAKTAVVIPNPLQLGAKMTDEDQMRHGDYYHDKRNDNRSPRFLVIFDDGSYANAGAFVAEPVATKSHDDVIAFLKKLSKTPSNGDYGTFVSAANATLNATRPCALSEVNTTSDGGRAKAGWNASVLWSEKMTGNRPVQAVGSNLIALPRGFNWIKLDRDKALDSTDVLLTPVEIFRACEQRLLEKGAQLISVKKAGLRFQVGGQSLRFEQALQKVARDYSLRVTDAADVLMSAARTPWAKLFSVKTSADKAPPGGGADDDQQPMDPSMMAPPAPPPPTGLDLAVAEQLQQIQMQIQALQQQGQALQTVQMRAQQIDGGGGAMAAPMGAAAMAGGQSPVVGGMPPQPMQQGAPMQGPPGQGTQMGPAGVPPAMQAPGGDPSMQGGMDPSMQGGMDPSMQGMDPNAMQQAPAPPQAMMASEQVTPQNVEQSINPQFMDSANALNDEQVFDAAAVASIVKQKSLTDLANAYAPNLEKAVDNLGRLRLQFAIKEPEYKEMLGNDDYVQTEQTLKDVFRGLGDAVIEIDRMNNTPVPQ